MPGQRNKGWKPLHQVLYDPQRNFLYNRLGYSEDSASAAVRVRAIADCGDAPYELRAYFAWKFGLPFRFRRCTRGTSRRGPRCTADYDNRLAEFDKEQHPVARFNAFLGRSIAWQVHSGTMRTLPNDEASDFYPIAMNREAIRPGTVFVDVGGHVFVMTQWDENGLYGIDGHPDKTVTRRKFSDRYFHVYRGMQTGGFKAFRPIVFQEDELMPLPNSALEADFSVEQYRFSSPRGFYKKMDQLIEKRQQALTRSN